MPLVLLAIAFVGNSTAFYGEPKICPHVSAKVEKGWRTEGKGGYEKMRAVSEFHFQLTSEGGVFALIFSSLRIWGH